MRFAAIVLLMVVMTFGNVPGAAGADDMWSTLRSTSKTPAQRRAELEAEERQAQIAPKSYEPPTGPMESGMLNPDLKMAADCYKPINDNRNALLAKILEQKLLDARNLSPEERRAFEADLAEVKAAVRSKSGDIPGRAYQRLSADEEMRLLRQDAEFSHQLATKCQKMMKESGQGPQRQDYPSQRP